MMHLKRKRGQKVVIVLEDGRKLEIKVSEVKGKKASLEFDIPEDIRVGKKENYKG